MRLFAAAGLLTCIALAGTSGACAALDGLSDYQECGGACADTKGGSGDGSSTAEIPMDSGESTPDGTAPVEEATTADDEAGGEADVGLPDASSSHEAGARVGDSGIDAPVDAGMAAAPPPMTGATCGPVGTSNRCASSQACCESLTSQTNACAATCASNATLGCVTPSDCPSSAPLCCAQATFTIDSAGDLPPKCAVASFSAACATACNDAPPQSCTFLGTLRLCHDDADCQSDSNNPLAGGQCWNFNKAPQSWCTSAAVGNVGGGVHQP
jgi:hypothetical protein